MLKTIAITTIFATAALQASADPATEYDLSVPAAAAIASDNKSQSASTYVPWEDPCGGPMPPQALPTS